MACSMVQCSWGTVLVSASRADASQCMSSVRPYSICAVCSFVTRGNCFSLRSSMMPLSPSESSLLMVKT